MSDPDEWGTVIEVAKRLELHARQVRRYAEKLGPKDRTPEGQTPLRVRVSSIMALQQRTAFGAVRLETERTQDGTGRDKRDSVPTGSAPTLQQIASLYEERLRDKEALIAEQTRMIRLLEEDRQADREQIADLKARLSIEASRAEPIKDTGQDAEDTSLTDPLRPVRPEVVAHLVKILQQANDAAEASSETAQQDEGEMEAPANDTVTAAKQSPRWWEFWRSGRR